MQRYFVEQIKQEQFLITGDDAKHISRVMRMESGDSIICLSEREGAYLCQLLEVSSDEVSAKPMEAIDLKTELPVHVTIAQGLPKGDKLDYIVQKGTELGASRFIPMQTSRAIVKWDEKKSRKKIERLQKIAKEAAEQSYRAKVPVVENSVSFKGLIEQSKQFDQILVAYEEVAKQHETSQLANVLQTLENEHSILVVIGPEGGLSEDEVCQLEQVGAKICGLGPRILRTETASLYVLAALSYQLELLR
ncbi:16S rRNA methyltransferase [Alkalihalobacillus alcalophilus ATCC 27647 = CGMCC 1.3604]|uniref:Ribosomal RNA small subunit methyltransferase E n=1 Tax=Alkalihalobacillus alcalophilus ATCC 27647 = CGMCC 1.3604 TaxID=1218173 RepID=A0A094WL20_ALKAL|nr:16S rRNA (uracil(1498)-N(3))-methyltransferase [Alkalihalobacillus alcalophilus]KGA98449.1 16S rRNA methyltransferase [Alkalihalobacillus alcalophilus ATCC 27647 = CGMCC 1.3604]MED1563331.1 16S rRNA (uracil(1498)-N(3))-methyltransferase [Alkalihalobacillus alcalophilus]THG88519.1 16S rRNA methyltransferase [Alkalihalobacillus alcalophilus ATCC 27647 = CGMCC 1.3604]